MALAWAGRQISILVRISSRRLSLSLRLTCFLDRFSGTGTYSGPADQDSGDGGGIDGGWWDWNPVFAGS